MDGSIYSAYIYTYIKFNLYELVCHLFIQNRMEESLRLFRQISNTYFFRNISMVCSALLPLYHVFSNLADRCLDHLKLILLCQKHLFCPFQILFLNKYDLFCDKILYSERHLKYYFHGFKGIVPYIHHKVLLYSATSL